MLSCTAILQVQHNASSARHYTPYRRTGYRMMCMPMWDLDPFPPPPLRVTSRAPTDPPRYGITYEY